MRIRCGSLPENSGIAREELEFDRITAVIAPDNKASVRLAGKLGFTFVKDTVYQNQTCRLYVNEEGTEA